MVKDLPLAHYGARFPQRHATSLTYVRSRVELTPAVPRIRRFACQGGGLTKAASSPLVSPG